MPKKAKLPKASEKEIQELTRACQFAFANDEIDDFLDRVFEEARRFRERREARGEQNDRHRHY